MLRSEAAAFLGDRLGQYLSAAQRTPADTAGNLKSIIDDSLLALGFADSELVGAEVTGDSEVAGWKLQLQYRALLQITRDLAVFINFSSAGDSFSLQAIRAAAEKDLARAEEAVLARFGTLDVVSSTGGIRQFRYRFLQPQPDTV